jgi:hypothetical protein
MAFDLANAFLQWTALRAALARGYWLAAALYLVVFVAHLTPAQLIPIGTFQGITVLIAEIPSGVLADIVSRLFVSPRSYSGSPPLSLVGVALGALALRLVEARITSPGVIKRTYALSCTIGVAGLFLFANAPDVEA